MRIWSLLLIGVSLPVLAVAGSSPRPPRGFASERFTLVVAISQFPASVWHAVDSYTRFGGVADAGASRRRPDGSCVYSGRPRVLAFGGVGGDMDFVVYHHFFGEGPIPPDHDHVLVFKYSAGREPSLAFSCVGAQLKPTIAAVRSAVASGRCTAESDPVETH